jgi:hypothetical protein
MKGNWQLDFFWTILKDGRAGHRIRKPGVVQTQLRGGILLLANHANEHAGFAWSSGQLDFH